MRIKRPAAAKWSVTLIFAAGLGPAGVVAAPTELPRSPGPELNLVLTAPVATWDEAVPLGNGLMGGLLWGEGNRIRLSLDRGDLWDERPADGFRAGEFNYATMKRLVAERRQAEFNEIFDSNWNDRHPTKIPAGRLEITLDPGRRIKSFELNLASAEGGGRFADGGRLDAFFSAAAPVALVRIPGTPVVGLHLTPPASLAQLGYVPAIAGSSGGVQWFLQTAAGGLRYCACVGSRRDGGATLLAATVTSSEDGAEPIGLARARVTAALAAGYDAMLRPHLAWWSDFWRQSSVFVPDAPILRQYYLARYFYGAASRRGAPPMPLQGVWTADAGELPPWKGDYHNDLNTQMTYVAYLAAGNFDAGACFLDFLWNRLPAFRRFAGRFYGAPGAAVPGVMSLSGQPLGGWGQYSLSPTMGAWCGWLFYQHWRYTGDDRFLRDRAYPWCREVGQCLRSLLKADARGVLKLPLSTSPEVFGNTAGAWLTPNSNFDSFCLKAFFLSLEEMASAAGRPGDAADWAAVAGALGDSHRDARGVLMLDADRELSVSHRHLSSIMGIYPFNLITVEGSAADRRVIAATLAHWDRLGTSKWVGYSFSWMACLRARVGQGEAALHDLDLFTHAFILRNGFHANGDQTRSGLVDATYRPFTLEGNFLAMQAVQEMLVQSWSPHPGGGDAGVIRIFPAMAWRWHEAAFADLRTEGGCRVSARRENNATTWFRIVAGRDGIVRIRDNFGGRPPVWSRGGVKRVGEDFQLELRQGESIAAALARPATIPPAPPDAARAVISAAPPAALTGL